MSDAGNEKIRQLMINVNRIDGIYYRSAKRTGIKENTLSLFYALSDGKSHSQKEICDEWLIPRSTINTVVRECIDSGYVSINKGSHTKEKNLHLTERGKDYANELMNDLFAVEQAAFSKTIEQYGDEFVQALTYFTDELEQLALHGNP